MTAQQLKNSILLMAVQGKLVPQDPNDEPASVLLERIHAEKERLIKEKKIKREKNPSVIFKGADNTPYEKIGDEVRSLADEVPFDIPDSWEWVRLGSVIELQSGQDMTPDKYNDNGKGIPYITGASNIENGNVIINRWTEYGRAFAYCGDILLTCKGTVGTMAILREPQVHIARQIMAIRPIGELYVPYIQLVLDTLVENLKAAAKSMIPGIAREDVLKSFFPAPPLSEQKRIVQKVSELSPWLEQYAVADTRLLSLNTTFPEALKKSILQEAVQGKLVPQDPNDEPAEALLERIRAEKQRLIKEGKIKKDKHESVIFRRDNSHYEKLDGVERCIDDELPFEIPENWHWCKIGTIFTLQAGKNIQAAEIHENPFADCYPCYGGNGIRGYVTSPNRTGDYPIIGRQGALCGNVNRATGEFYATEHAVCVETYSQISVAWACLFLTALNLNQYATATAQPGLAVANINEVYIPLPPLAEQHRIVQRIEELLPLVKGL